MRKLIIAGAVALVLFIVGAFAASFAVDSEDVASGADAVTKCATNVDVDFATSYDASVGEYVVDTVDLTFTGAPGTCDGEVATVALELEDGSFEEVTGTVVDGGATDTASIDGEGILAKDVAHAAVLIDDTTIPSA